MLHNKYAPTSWKSRDADPSVSAEEKLRRITASPVSVRDYPYREGFIVTLPYGPRAEFISSGGPDKPLGLDSINIRDAALYRRGLGSRLLRAGLQYAASQTPELSYLQVGIAQLGFLNTLATVLGEENVYASSASTAHEHIKGHPGYGMGTKNSLGRLLVDYRVIEGEAYYAYGVWALVDTEIAQTWEAPQAAD